jgi:hypothetical protein
MVANADAFVIDLNVFVAIRTLMFMHESNDMSKLVDYISYLESSSKKNQSYFSNKCKTIACLTIRAEIHIRGRAVVSGP